jgi:hypothetical protein
MTDVLVPQRRIRRNKIHNSHLSPFPHRGNRLRGRSALRAAMAAYARSIEHLDPRDPRRSPSLPKLTFMEELQ